MPFQRFLVLQILLLFSVLMPAVQSGDAAEPLNRTPSPGEYQTPDQTIAAMTLPEGFNVNVFAAEPDLVQPIAFCIDGRGRLWVIENYSYPDWAEEGRDRILILEDTDNDGAFDERTVFWDKGNFATGIQVGFGGVYVGSPPNLLFIPDRDRDDEPDGEPVVLLDGWGHHDTHETLNSFIWGPDGWLYGCQGVFTHSLVGKPGTSKEDRIPLNACIWRYHPTRHEFEIFAEGGSNQWGVDFNDHGQAFMTACVIPHLFHVIQGGRYTRQAGQHNNPYTYEDIETIRTHKHFAAAFAGAMIYLGDNFPAKYRNQIFMNNIHANKVHVDWLSRKGSGYVGEFGPHDRPAGDDDRGAGFINNGDQWYRGLCLRTGPDGGVFINDWYDRLPCHQIPPNDKTNGRIYKVNYGTPEPVSEINLPALSSEELAELQVHDNDWWVRTARRILQERAEGGEDLTSARDRLINIAHSYADVADRLRGVWALHVTGGIDDDEVLALLADSQEYIRAWAIQSAAEDRSISDAIAERLVALAKDDPSSVVRLYLASACQRLPAAQSLPIVMELIQHEEDADDHNLPLMIWYAAEPLVAEADQATAARLIASCKIPKVRQFMARRLAAGK